VSPRRILMAGLAAAALASPAAAEVTVGAFGGAVVLDRSIPGNADQGGDAFLLGARAGFTAPLAGAWRWGAEAEAWAGQLRSSSGGLAHRFEADGGAGAYARLGWRGASGVMPFVRVGVATLLPELRGRPAVGVGLEAPLAGRWSLRADLGLAQGDTQVWTATLGLGWRF
jgi:opacity protein-like surface antigen